jgi:hypothetical protein
VLATSLESLVQLQIIFVARDRSRNQDFLAPKKSNQKTIQHASLCVGRCISSHHHRGVELSKEEEEKERMSLYSSSLSSLSSPEESSSPPW